MEEEDGLVRWGMIGHGIHVILLYSHCQRDGMVDERHVNYRDNMVYEK